MNTSTSTQGTAMSVELDRNDLQVIAYALQGQYLGRVTGDFQRNRVARGIRRNDLDALRYAFPASQCCDGRTRLGLCDLH